MSGEESTQEAASTSGTPDRRDRSKQANTRGGQKGHFGRFARLARKELRETLRDRRTIATLVLMPLLIYPLISLLFQKFLVGTYSGGEQSARHFVIAFESEGEQRQFARLLSLGDAYFTEYLTRESRLGDRSEDPSAVDSQKGLEKQPNTKSGPTGAMPFGGMTAPTNPATANYRLESTVVADMRREITEKQVDLGIRVKSFPWIRRTKNSEQQGREGDDAKEQPLDRSPKANGKERDKDRSEQTSQRVGVQLPSANEPARLGRRGNPYPHTKVEKTSTDNSQPGLKTSDKRNQDGGSNQVQGRDDSSDEFQLEVELIYSDRLAGIPDLLDYLEVRLQAVNRADRDIKLVHAGFSPDEMPVRMNRTALENPEKAGGLSLAGIIPLILILMTITGAVYPAIDLAAGERERGTLEILAAAPISRMSLLSAKYIAVLTVAILTAVVNLTAMMVTIRSSGMGRLLLGEEALSWQTMLQIFALLVLFAALFSAVLLAITSFARSFKEAQAYLIPLMLASIAPGILALMPSLKLEGGLTVVPLANIVLLSRDLFLHQVQVGTATIVVLTTGLYALGAIAIAARVFGTDAILYGSQESWSDLFQRPERVSPAPSLSSALLCLAFLFPLQILVGGYFGQYHELPLAYRLTLTSLLSTLLYIGCPLVAAWLRRVDLRQTASWHNPNWLAWVAAIVLGMTAWLTVIELVNLARLASPDDAPVLRELTAQLLQEFRTVSPLVLLLALAIVPAITEEFFFRGFLLGALRQRFGDLQCVLISGVLFGVFHLVVRDSLAVERLLPSTLLGFLLGWICLRTGSLFPGIVMHAINNGLVLMLMYYRTEVEQWLTKIGWNIDEAAHVPWPLLAFSATGLALGCGLLLVVRPDPSR